MPGESLFECPQGKVVIGCNAGLHPGTHHYTYPSADGKGCMIYTATWSMFTATCADPIVDYEITSAVAGSAKIAIANCTLATNMVIGCGFKSIFADDKNALLSVIVSGRQSCSCSDMNGLFCYAICGKL